jgi:prepilin-type N-terminal cleavage/methylation domain-containing protein
MALRSHSGQTPSTHDPRPAPSTLDPRPARRAVTLIELLIVMVIIAILAGLILGVAAVAGETARESQSKHTVLRLHKLLMEHYDTYKTRRVGVRQEVLDDINAQTNWNARQKGHAKAAARLNALRELMMMEIPDRWGDIHRSPDVSRDAPYFLDVYSSGNTYRTALSAIYLRRYQQYAFAAKTSQQKEALLANQGAECLYLIITLACGDGEARSQFGEDSIGDTDGDGAYEFLDGWGQPIQFLRWAPGFDSQVQINANTLDNPPADAAQKWAAAASGDHDPFDLYRVDVSGFRLVPLIYSAGRDNAYGIQTADSYFVRGVQPQRLDEASVSDWYPVTSAPKAIRPWAKVDNSLGYLGTAIPEGGAADNIHNHLLGRR